MLKRTLGRSGLTVSALGLGCWAIGGPFLWEGVPDGWGTVSDDDSIAAIQRGIDLGITFFDTADAYGTGHSERVLGRAIGNRRREVVIATKFGYCYDEARRELRGTDISPDYIRRACRASLQRLGTDYIDLYQLHIGEAAHEQTLEVWATLDQLQREGLIRAYGWSTANPERAHLFATEAHGAAIQHAMNVLADAPEIVAICAEHNLASICNTPLAMGLLSGKFTPDSRLPADDVRASGQSWVNYFDRGTPSPLFLDQLAAIREVLTAGGRTLVAGALAWIWARSAQTIPIPGFKTVRQVEELAQALAAGPLTDRQVAEIEALLRSLREQARGDAYTAQESRR